MKAEAEAERVVIEIAQWKGTQGILVTITYGFIVSSCNVFTSMIQANRQMSRLDCVTNRWLTSGAGDGETKIMKGKM